MTFYMSQGSVMRVNFRGRCSIGEVQVSLFVAGAVFVVKSKCDFSWQVQYLVKFNGRHSIW